MPRAHDKPVRILTVGHSNRSAEQFVDLLKAAGVEQLVDVRRHPGSRSFPHFNREPLEHLLAAHGIGYAWFEALGGRRSRKDAPPAVAAQERSPNDGLRNASFRRYADYMQTDTFRRAIRELLDLAAQRTVAILCAEAVYWQCHRRLISDYLVAQGVQVDHILAAGDPRPHTLTPGAAIQPDGSVHYPA